LGPLTVAALANRSSAACAAPPQRCVRRSPNALPAEDDLPTTPTMRLHPTRAIDPHGQVIDVPLSGCRDATAGRR